MNILMKLIINHKRELKILFNCLKEVTSVTAFVLVCYLFLKTLLSIIYYVSYALGYLVYIVLLEKLNIDIVSLLGDSAIAEMIKKIF